MVDVATPQDAIPAEPHSAASGGLKSSRPLRIGFISPTDPDDPNRLSWMPFRMRQELVARGAEVISIAVASEVSRWRRRVRAARSWTARRLPKQLRHSLRATGRAPHAMLDHFIPWYGRRRFLKRARTGSQRMTDAISRCDVDVLFGCCISANLYDLCVDVPIVYFSDATARLINECYPSNMCRSSGYKKACDEV